MILVIGVIPETIMIFPEVTTDDSSGRYTDNHQVSLIIWPHPEDLIYSETGLNVQQVNAGFDFINQNFYSFASDWSISECGSNQLMNPKEQAQYK